MLRKSIPTIIAAMLVLCCSNVAFGFDPMGPPKAGLSEGDGGWQVEYIYSQMDVKAGGALGLPGAVIKDMQMNKIYANFAYGINNQWEVFGRIGVADASIDRSKNITNLVHLNLPLENLSIR